MLAARAKVGVGIYFQRQPNREGGVHFCRCLCKVLVLMTLYFVCATVSHVCVSVCLFVCSRARVCVCNECCNVCWCVRARTCA